MIHRHKNLRVGVVGASPGKSWAARSHIPAIAAVSNLTLEAVATSTAETAAAAAAQFGARNAFVGIEEMAASPDVDLIIVAVKVPAHRYLVGTALDAGKHVYCEWPLAKDPSEAALMAAEARNAPGRTAVGLQARSSPTIRFMRDLISSGYIGEVESCSVRAFFPRGADPVPDAQRYLFDKDAGANLLTIQAGHLLDTVCFLLREPEEIRSYAPLRRPLLTDVKGAPFRPTSADTLATTMTTVSGAPVSIHLAQGTHALFQTEVCLIGSKGALVLKTAAPGGIQMAPLELYGASTTTTPLRPLTVPATYRNVTEPGRSSAVNVAEALAAFVRDVREGTHVVPDFDDALVRHRSLERMLEATMFASIEPLGAPQEVRSQ